MNEELINLLRMQVKVLDTLFERSRQLESKLEECLDILRQNNTTFNQYAVDVSAQKDLFTPDGTPNDSSVQGSD